MDRQTQRRDLLWELAYIVTEAEKSHDVSLQVGEAGKLGCNLAQV